MAAPMRGADPPVTAPSAVTSQTRSLARARSTTRARGVLQVGQHRAPVDHGARAHGVVEHDRQRRRPVPRHPQPRQRARGGQGDEQHDDHAQQHQQDVAHLEFARVVLLGAQQVAHGRKLDAHLDLAAPQVQPERNRRRKAQQQRQRREQAHGSRRRERKARRTGTAKGASV